MPITKSAQKAQRQAATHEVANKRVKKEMRETVRSLEKAIDARSTDEAARLLSVAYKKLDKAAKKGVIHHNTASRKKSRLYRAVKRLLVPSQQK